MAENILELKKLTKSFDGNCVLRDVDILFKGGCCHGLMGENGAGKSTLIKLIMGIHQPTSGERVWKGETIKKINPHTAKVLGIATVHQELTLVDTLSIYENVFLGNEPKSKYGLNDKNKMISESQKLLEELDLHVDVREKVSVLDLSDKQMVEIAKALALDPEVLILDEGTSSLTDEKVEIVLNRVKKFTSEGKVVILVSHRMKEIFDFCDCITVLKDGKKVANKEINEVTTDDIIELMTGMENNRVFPPKLCEDSASGNITAPLLRVEDLTTAGGLRDISLELAKGEILGIGGLQGMGQIDLVNALFGIEKITHGKIYLNNKEVRIKHPWNAIKNGIFMVPQSRRTEGLFVDLNITTNMVACNLDDLSTAGMLLHPKKEQEIFDSVVKKLHIKLSSKLLDAKFLSGGNQQKVSLGRWLAKSGQVFILVEPTRGIDVKTKFEIYKILRDLANSGYGIIMVTSEMEELVGMADRVLVLYEHRLAGEFSDEDINDSHILQASFGRKEGIE